MKKQNDGSSLRRIAREIGKEAARQTQGFPREFGRQLTQGWGNEFAHQIFGVPRRHRRRRWSR